MADQEEASGTSAGSPETAFRDAAIYVALTALLSSPFWFYLIKHGIRHALPIAGLMWCPATAGIITALVVGRPLKAFGWRLPPWGYLAAGYVIPLVYATLAYAVVWGIGAGAPDLAKYAAATHISFARALFMVGIVGVAIGSLFALGEEIGWRGFLVPVLATRLSRSWTAFVAGTIWALWHVPLIVFSDYNNGSTTPAWYSVACFAVGVIGVSYLFTWARLASGSLWPCMLMHASHNAWVQEFFTPLTRDTGHTAWYIDEFGAMLPVAIIVTAFVVLRWSPSVARPVPTLASVAVP
jgi:membrane protease YdiL (CAAX protease family)